MEVFQDSIAMLLGDFAKLAFGEIYGQPKVRFSIGGEEGEITVKARELQECLRSIFCLRSFLWPDLHFWADLFGFCSPCLYGFTKTLIDLRRHVINLA